MSRRERSLLRTVTVAALVMLAAACGGPNGTPSSPTASPLPLAAESTNFRYYYSSGDSVQVERQEAFHAWAVERLGVAVPRKIDYRTYASRDDMQAMTGVGNTNAYAEPETFTTYTLWSWDNHETVHICLDAVGVIESCFQQAMGASLSAAEAEWLVFVG